MKKEHSLKGKESHDAQARCGQGHSEAKEMLSEAQPVNSNCLLVQAPGGGPSLIPRESALMHKRSLSIEEPDHLGTGEHTAALFDIWSLDRPPQFHIATTGVSRARNQSLQIWVTCQ